MTGFIVFDVGLAGLAVGVDLKLRFPHDV